MDDLSITKLAFYQETPKKNFEGVTFSHKFPNILIASSKDGFIYILVINKEDDYKINNITL